LLLLTSTSDKIQVITSSTADIDVHASYVDLAAGVVTPGRTNSKITTATTTDVVGAPAASTTRNVKTLHVANIHASSSNVVTLQLTDGTNVIQIESVTLLAGERISYREGIGTRVIDAQGIEKVQPPVVAPIYVKSLSADQSNSTTTPTNVTGLEIACGVGNWMFEYYLRVQSAATTTGHKFSVNHDGTVTAFMAQVEWTSALGTASDANPDQDIVTAAGGLTPVFAARAKSTAGWGTTLSVDTANADVMYMVYGMCVVTVDGNLELWHGSEVAAASTVKAGSAVRLTKTG
jgi:hypothetical protein